MSQVHYKILQADTIFTLFKFNYNIHLRWKCFTWISYSALLKLKSCFINHIPKIIFTRSVYYPKLLKVIGATVKKSHKHLLPWVGLAWLIQIDMFTCRVVIYFMHMNANKCTQHMVRRVTSRFVASKTRHLKAQLAIEFREDPTAVLPGSLTFSSRSSMLSTSCSLGEWSTTTVDPNTHIALPTFPSRLRRSFKNRDDKTSLKWKQLD